MLYEQNNSVWVQTILKDGVLHTEAIPGIFSSRDRKPAIA